ncbi:MAG: molybdopterin oxidoreductase [Bdellovibrionota bacterium]
MGNVDHNHSHKLEVGTYVVSQKLKGIMFSFILIGLLTLVVGYVVDKERIWQSFLTNFFYFTSLALGGLFFTAIQYVTKAGWSAGVRRVFESLTAFLPVALVAAIVIIAFGSHSLFEWLHTDVVNADPILKGKQGYLNMPFFAIRTVVFFAIWMLFQKLIVGNSLKQDKTGDESLTHKNVSLSVGFLILFALTYSLFSIDFVMSLHPHWFSTMFGVYTFAGLFQASLSLITIIVIKLMDKGLVKGFVTEEHLHDLGKFMFAFTVFYAYIAFSQFMLIWYANLPEETIFYAHRAHGGWMAVSFSLLIFKFVVPFLMLLPRGAKRDKGHLVRVGCLILIMQWVDIYWLVYPNFNEGHVVFSYQEVGLFLGFLGLFIFTVTKFLSKNSLVAIKDPYIHESNHHHVL